MSSRTAIQFVDSSNKNIGLPLIIDTGNTSNYGLPTNFGALAAAYGIKAPVGYKLDSSAATVNTAYDTVASTVTPNKPNNNQKHVVTNDDVNNAAKNDNALQTALNNWNAKNGNTKANANALINAINADNTLNNANNNLNNIINSIKDAENNPSNHGNLDNLLKLYNLYMGLVNSGLFNN